jgi:hypothetical protein
MQGVAPSVALYMSGGHSAQSPAPLAAPVAPGRHTQEAEEGLPVAPAVPERARTERQVSHAVDGAVRVVLSEKVLMGQAPHDAGPEDALNVPAPH